jgi:hypothetical protein
MGRKRVYGTSLRDLNADYKGRKKYHMKFWTKFPWSLFPWCFMLFWFVIGVFVVINIVQQLWGM